MKAKQSSGSKPITVVVVDDEELIRRVVSGALSEQGLEVVDEAADGERGVQAAVDLRPDVVLMDLSLAGISGIEAIEQLAVLAPASRILVLSATEGRREVVKAI